MGNVVKESRKMPYIKLAKLIGEHTDIAYARAIRSAKLTQIKTYISSRVDALTDNQERVKIKQQSYNAQLALCAKTSAEWWITHRDMPANELFKLYKR